MKGRPAPLTAVLLLAACVGTSPPEMPAPGAGDSIELTRGPCFGACPMYTLTVRGDGTVRFAGERFVRATGEHTATIEPAAAAALFALADSIGFFGLPGDITPANEEACGASWTDMPSAETSIRWNPRGHSVRHYHGCPKAPERLTDFENRIDAVAGSARWIGQR